MIQLGREGNVAKRIRQRQAQAIRQVRMLRGLSKRELADAINAVSAAHDMSDTLSVTPGAVSQWENAVATPRPVMQLAIAVALDVPWSTLFSLEGETL